MKKSRPATKISVLCDSKTENILSDLILKESTTLGIRSYEVSKTMLQRDVRKVKTKYGDIDVKLGMFEGKPIKIKPEYDQCKNAALQNNLPITEIISEVKRVFFLE